MSLITGKIVLKETKFLSDKIQMKINMKSLILSTFLISSLLAREWVETTTAQPTEPVWTTQVNSPSEIEISFDLGGYFLQELSNGKKQISFPGGVPNLEEGSPDLPRMAHSIIIPDLAHMELSIIESEFVDIPMEDIVSSKESFWDCNDLFCLSNVLQVSSKSSNCEMC